MGRSRWFLGVVTVVAFPAVLLTLNRVVQPDAGWSIRIVAFTPYAFPVYVACLLVVLGVLVRDRAARRRRVVVLAVCIALGAGLHARWLAPWFTGDVPKVAGETFTVMNLNLLRGGADAAQVVELVDARGVEVLVLQEVTPDAVTALRAAGLEEQLPRSAGRPVSGVEGTMVFSDARITRVEPLPATFGAWAMTLSMPAGDVRLHAVHPAAPVGDARPWRHDFGVLASTLRQDPADLMVGDFNATPDHRALQELGLRDAAEMTNQGWRPSWPDNGTTDLLGVPVPRLVSIDHVLLGDDLAAVRVDTTSVDHTDHGAVIAEVGFR